MLRSCARCTRQLELSLQTALHASTSAPVASTSGHVFEKRNSSSTSPATRSRRRPSSSGSQNNAQSSSLSSTGARRTFTRSAGNLQAPEQAVMRGDGAPMHGWKGKARATEPPHTTPSPSPFASYADAQKPARETTALRQTEVQNPPESSSAAGGKSVQEYRRLFATSIAKEDLTAALHFLAEVQIARLQDPGRLDRRSSTEDLGRIRVLVNETASQDAEVLRRHLEHLHRIVEAVGSRNDSTGDWEAVIWPVLSLLAEQQEVYSSAKARRRTRSLLRRVESMCIANGNTEPWRTFLEAVFTALETDSRWDNIVKLGAMVKEGDSFSWTPDLLRIYLKSALHERQPGLAPLIPSLPPNLFPLSREIYHLLLRAHLANRNLGAAREVLDSMLKYQIRLTEETYLIIFSGHRSLGQNERLFEAMFGDKASGEVGVALGYSTRVLNTFIEAHIRRGDLPAALEVFEQFHASRRARSARAALPPPPNSVAKQETLAVPAHPHPSASSIADPAILDSVASPEETPLPPIPSASAQTPLSAASPLEPDASTYALFVQAYTSLGDLDKALDFYNEMVESGCTPSPFMSTALIQAFAGTGRIEDAKTAIREIEGRSSTLDNASAASQLSRTSSILPARQARAYESIIPHILRTEGLPGLTALISEMSDSGVRLPATAISMILDYLADSGAVGAPRLAELAVALRQHHDTPANVSDLNVLLTSFVRREQSLPLRDLPAVAKPLPAPPAFSPRFERKGERLRAYQSLVRQLFERGVQPDSYTSAILMQRYADRAGSPALLWQYFKRQVLDRGLRPTGHHIFALMTAYLAAGDPVGARTAMDRGNAMGIAPTIVHYTALIKYLLRVGKNDLAQRLYSQVAAAEGIKPDLYFYAVFMEWAAGHGQIKLVNRYMQQAKKALPGMVWPNTVLETIRLKARIVRREHLVGQVELESAISAGLRPDKVLLQSLKKHLADLRRYRRKGANAGDGASSTASGSGRGSHVGRQETRLTEEALKKLDDAIVLAKQNLETLRHRFERERQVEHGGPTKAVGGKEILRVLEAVLENRRATQSAS